jgi:DHA1 family inner membrane transport protein
MHDKYNDLVISNTLRTFALSLISLFLPIFLLRQGFDVMEVVIFEIFLLTGSIFSHFHMLKMTKYGLKRMMIISYLISIVFYIILYNTQTLLPFFGKFGYLVIIAVTNIAFASMFWTAFHLYFIKSTKAKETGSKYGFLLSIPVVLGIVSPFVGSLLITYAGFNMTFLVAIILVSIGGVALLFSKEIKFESKPHVKKMFGFDRHMNMMFFFEGANIAATSFLWPIILFVLGIQILSMGFLYLFSNLLFALTSFYSGKISDMHGNRKIMSIGSLGHGLSLVLRAVSRTIYFMTFAQSLGGLFGALLFIPFRSKFYKLSHKDASNSIMNREIYHHIGRIAVFCIILFLLFFVPVLEALVITLLICALLTLGFSIVIREMEQA